MNRRDQMQAIREASSNERLAVELFEHIRWGDSPACPRCGSVKVRKMMGKDGQREKHYRWRCADCVGPRQFSVRTASVLEETRLPLRIWAHAYWRACASKKGVSALQLARECSIRHQTALFLLNRIRWGMRVSPDAAKLTGTCEADEVYIGGKPRRKNRQVDGLKQGPKGNLVPVLAVVQREGTVRAQPVPKVTADNLKAFLLDNVATSARLMTDEHQRYLRPGRLFYSHESVSHSAREYARGDVSTNRVEGFFGLFRRKLMGAHHAVSREHLFRYVDEAAFLYNSRKLTDEERVAAAVKAGEGKRLTYREPASEAA